MIGNLKVGVVVLNYRDADLAIKMCSYIAHYDSIDQIVIVDNLSPDDSFTRLQKIQDPKIDVIQTKKNGGYSYGNNFGALYLINKYNIDVLIIANTDVEFTEEFLLRIVQNMLKYKSQASSGYMMCPNEDNNIWESPTIRSYWRELLDCTILLQRIVPVQKDLIAPSNGIIQVEWLPGSLFAVDAKAFKTLRGFDEHVFLFYEEQILGEKFLQAGYQMILDTDIFYLHNHTGPIHTIEKRLFRVKQVYKSKYYLYTRYEKINWFQRGVLKGAIYYGIAVRKVLYKLIYLYEKLTSNK